MTSFATEGGENRELEKHDVKDNDGDTALHSACLNGHTEIVQL